MRRYHAEKQLIENRAKKYKQLNADLSEGWGRLVVIEKPFRVGRFRKTARCSGCTRARCQVCHPEKFPKRIPTRQEVRAKKDLQQED